MQSETSVISIKSKLEPVVTDSSLIKVRNLSKSFKEKTVFGNINVDFGNRQLIAITGPSGIGKSCLLKILSGLDKDFNGIVERKKCRTTYMFQTNWLLPWLTVIENIKVPLIISKSSVDHKDNIKEMLVKLNLKNTENMYPHELSGGMQSRVTLVRALIVQPKILFMDEPTADHDYDTKKLVMNLVKKYIIENDACAIWVTHDLPLANRCATQFYVMKKRETQFATLSSLEQFEL